MWNFIPDLITLYTLFKCLIPEGGDDIHPISNIDINVSLLLCAHIGLYALDLSNFNFIFIQQWWCVAYYLFVFVCFKIYFRMEWKLSWEPVQFQFQFRPNTYHLYLKWSMVLISSISFQSKSLIFCSKFY